MSERTTSEWADLLMNALDPRGANIMQVTEWTAQASELVDILRDPERLRRLALGEGEILERFARVYGDRSVGQPHETERQAMNEGGAWFQFKVRPVLVFIPKSEQKEPA